ncbi:Uncharacterised protein [Bordetella pertussis]|nr:Uncharacterised protein [Bordetella pertussis]CFN55079.1 Uncharacterised protein [Bordetella pertussis]CFN72523.1 Uncharacterised protein [Bordetella pertussis]CFO01398.1 Uncharacterised protein [Bordetella pertussis]CFO04402.1 Uncharacterised protein [Bordetella pertussis]
MQLEFVLHLGNQGDHAGVVRTRADFGEPDLVAGHEQLHPEYAQAAQVAGHGQGDLARALQRDRRHGMGLPALDIVAIDLAMPDGLAELRHDLPVGAAGAHRQQGDLVVELDETLDDHASGAHAPALLGVAPRGGDVIGRADDRLALARGGHDRLDHARIADAAVDGLAQRLLGIDEAVGRGGQAQGLGGQPADAFAVHGQVGGAGGGRDVHGAFVLQRDQQVGGNGLDFGHDHMRALLLDDLPQRLRIGHGDHVGAMRHLVARRVGIAVDRDDLHPQALQGDHHLLA